ncbi:unnamed protein product [Vitrella brassicaformis CCMP3155]|uniref:Phosphoribosylformylglycinamidine synthase n=3 Tax=Vitrella brassicaformis TaxID=1169539 RepID=A0A0G4ELR3_VITBC|nr:unnamed protein product [Vitrella brassicaformis CCMP3155]|eukprot:CEL97959.1 unnamed protein product [Vitrella brassicaformis CCMP3155]
MGIEFMGSDDAPSMSGSPAILHYYRTPGLSEYKRQGLLQEVRTDIASDVESLDTEVCYNVEVTAPLTAKEEDALTYLLSETFEQQQFGSKSFLRELHASRGGKGGILEVGPRMTFCTAWSSNAVAICHSCGLTKVTRIERSRRYLFAFGKASDPTTNVQDFLQEVAPKVHDRMTECVYPFPITSFELKIKPEHWVSVDVMGKGRAALEAINKEMGLGYDEQDLDYYTRLFRDELKRNPTSIECFDLAQGNSEHSRHWFFNGKLVIDGQDMPETLFQLVKKPFKINPRFSTVAFRDNSSALRGYVHQNVHPSPDVDGKAAPYKSVTKDYDLTFTAETHNFPCGVAPFPGAETGTGGRLRDGAATGQGSLIIAGTAAYCVGALRIPGYDMEWEDSAREWSYPSNMADPFDILIEASNGASDYGNKFGEPIIQGYTRSFGLRLPDGERREWIKPIMFTGGIGQMDHRHINKGDAEKDMKIVKIGGPAYRIGMGGGAASSMVAGDNQADLDFNAVQRGDAEMENRANRVIRACVELGEANPVVSIHDQGAGGSGNVLKEITEPGGGFIDIRKMLCGDKTMSLLELWGAEYQENYALLIRPESVELFDTLCKREKAPYSVVGHITGDGIVRVWDAEDGTTPVDLPLEKVLGKMPQKVFKSDRKQSISRPLQFPADVTVMSALDRVLRLSSVGSKRFLTNKVDRSVTGLIAQQQCVGPLQLTLSDVAVVAQSHLGTTGGATAIGEQPIKGFLDCAAMGRLACAEALTNLVWAKVTAIEDVKASGNWMWAAKMEGEAANMYDAAKALSDFMIQIGMAIDGGKDSLSMAARDPIAKETVKAPGELTISVYAPCPDVNLTVMPDLKCGGDGVLLLIDLDLRGWCLGGSSLAHCYGQIGDQCPDVDAASLKNAFNAVQELIKKRLITAGHDRSDGGLITTVLEMAFGGNCGVTIALDSLPASVDFLHALFSEGPGLVFECAKANEAAVREVLQWHGMGAASVHAIGGGRNDTKVEVSVGGKVLLSDDVRQLRDIWEATSFQCELRQCNPECVAQERDGLKHRTAPPFKLTFDFHPTSDAKLTQADKIKVAIIREEGSNGDREMATAFHMAGFEAWDVTMTDISSGRVNLQDFRGVVFVGGFSYADVLDSAKGWAATILLSDKLNGEFEAFYKRNDTFSLGVCNGCQLMALLGWVPGLEKNIPRDKQPRFIHNASGRFESRWSAVRVESSTSIMLQGMEGSTLGIWVAHGEGQAYFPDPSVLTQCQRDRAIPLTYVDDQNQPTEAYPFNPNGSPQGIVGLCSPDGRHLALMPHPERCILTYQWPYAPQGWTKQHREGELWGRHVAPWIKMFQNARQWCERNA